MNIWQDSNNTLNEYVEVKNKKSSTKHPELNDWIKVTRFCAAGLKGVEVREIKDKTSKKVFHDKIVNRTIDDDPYPGCIVGIDPYEK